MANKNDITKTRMKAGDPAADIFERFLNKNGINYQNYGLNKQANITGKMPRFVRNTPDYIVKGKVVSLFEVKGFKDELWLKVNDVYEYKKWNNIMNIWYFFVLFEEGKHEYKIINHFTLMNLITTSEQKQHGDPNYYDDKWCYVIQWDSIRSVI